ncbi:pentatricopeptide repeat-containing protein At4g01030, mitochondrial-like [Aristolochia californica]|uniref:pentatricopeptide repeat-containing protein At4g01030, mitochondrial-like n=1 Tax=Aristolochia californica TaxID=171875 RepID=UPI0035D6EBC5
MGEKVHYLPGPSIPQTLFSNNRRNVSISRVLGVAGTFTKRPSSSSLTFSHLSNALDDPTKLTSLSSAKSIRAQILKFAEGSNLEQSLNELIIMSAKAGNSRLAALVLFMGFERESTSLDYLEKELNRVGMQLSEFLVVLRELHREGMLFNRMVLSAVLYICAKSMDFRVGAEIHTFIVKNGFDLYADLEIALKEFYCGSRNAEQLFNEMAWRTVPSWNEAIISSSENGLWLKCVELFKMMQFSHVKPSKLTITKVLQACGKLEALQQGMQIHGFALKTELLSDLLVRNSLISMYSKCSELVLARAVFDSMSSRSVVSWNSIISGYALKGFLSEAWDLYDKMERSEVKPDLVTWNSLIRGHSVHGSLEETLKVLHRMQLAGLRPNSSSITSALQVITEVGPLELGKEIHGYLMRNGLDDDIYTGTSLVDMYIKKGKLAKAQLVFDNMKNRNSFVWNSLISGYAYSGLVKKAQELLNEMEQEGLRPDLHTWNNLILGHAILGLNKQALSLIHHLDRVSLSPDVASWTALISGCCQKGNYLDSLKFYVLMQKAGIKPNSSTIASLLQACAGLASLDKGLELHCFVIKYGFDSDVYVATALIDMYCKSGNLNSAYHIFKKNRNINLASWNAMLMGLAAHGQGEEAISLFSEMGRLGLRPDAITFTALLSACMYSGLIGEGWKHFDSMKSDYSLVPTLQHYSCMVHLIGQNGYLDEAWDLIRTMELEPDASVWGALLGACRVHKNLELAEIAAKHLFKLEPYKKGNYMVMMNLYAMKGRWGDAEIMNDLVNVLGVKNMGGWCWIQINRTVHVFSAEGRPHPDIAEIYFELYQMILEMKKLGYVPDTDCVLETLDEEEKEKLLLSHPEKLAITFGLIKTGRSQPIKVIKNARVCKDCHTAAKYMSQISGREIVLKEGVRFHHFINGKCSCNECF